MKGMVTFAILLLCLSLFVSCVQVTTARRSEAVSETETGEIAKRSEVEVKTYGWDVLALTLEIILFPFKVAYHAVKIVL